MDAFVFLIEVPRLEVEWELQLPACTTATQDRSHVCDLQHSSQQHQTLNPLRKARVWTCILMNATLVRFRWATMGTSCLHSTSKKEVFSERIWQSFINKGLLRYALKAMLIHTYRHPQRAQHWQMRELEEQRQKCFWEGGITALLFAACLVLRCFLVFN